MGKVLVAQAARLCMQAISLHHVVAPPGIERKLSFVVAPTTIQAELIPGGISYEEVRDSMPDQSLSGFFQESVEAFDSAGAL